MNEKLDKFLFLFLNNHTYKINAENSEMTNLEGIARQLLRQKKTREEIIQKLIDEYQIFKKAPRNILQQYAEAILKEVEVSEKILRGSSSKIEKKKHDLVNTVITPIKANLKMGEGGVGCRGIGDNIVHEMISKISQTSTKALLSPLTLDDAGAVEITLNSEEKNSNSLVIVSKMEGMHSRLSEFPFLAGFHVTRAMLRDILIKGARPISIMVDIHLADDGDIGKLFDFEAGIATVAELAQVPITAGSTLRIGGDMVIGDRLTGGIAGVGILRYSFFRENIQPGDSMIMTYGSGGGTISTTALYHGRSDVVAETLNINFFKAVNTILSQPKICSQIHTMIDVTNGGLRNDLLEIQSVISHGFMVNIEKVRQMVNPRVLALLKETSVDYLGVSLDSLVIFCQPEVKEKILDLLNQNGIKALEIGQVIPKNSVHFIDGDNEEIISPHFREAAYTGIKKVIDQIEQVPTKHIQQLEKAFSDAQQKKNHILEVLKRSA